MQAFDEVTAVIGNDHSDIDAVNVDANRLMRLLRVFLGFNKRTHMQHGGKEQRRRKKTKKVHRSAIRRTGPNEYPWNLSTRHWKSNGDAARRLADSSGRANRGPWTARCFAKNSRFLRRSSSWPLRSNDPSPPANRLFENRNN